MRPATFEPQQIIEAGLALQAEGRNRGLRANRTFSYGWPSNPSSASSEPSS